MDKLGPSRLGVLRTTAPDPSFMVHISGIETSAIHLPFYLATAADKKSPGAGPWTSFRASNTGTRHRILEPEGPRITGFDYFTEVMALRFCAQACSLLPSATGRSLP